MDGWREGFLNWNSARYGDDSLVVVFFDAPVIRSRLLRHEKLRNG